MLAFFLIMKYCFLLPLFLLSIVNTSTNSISVMFVKCCLLFCYSTIFIICEYYYRGGSFRIVVSYWARRSLAFPLPWRFMPSIEGSAEALQGDILPWRHSALVSLKNAQNSMNHFPSFIFLYLCFFLFYSKTKF